MYFITYCQLPTNFGHTRYHHQGFSKQTNKIYIKMLIRVGKTT